MERTLPRPLDWRPFVVLSIAAIALLAWMGRDLTFAHDECVFLDRGFGQLLAPHNEHLLAVQLVVWHGTEAVFGSGSYLPYLAFLLVSQIALAAVVYIALGGQLMALAAVALLLLLGSASDSMFYAGLSGFVLSVAFGVAAMLLIEQRRYGWATVALVLAVASSGMGLPFLVAAIAMAVLQRDRQAWLLAIPVLAYGGWLITFGRDGLTSHTNPLDNIARVPGQVASWTLEGLGAVTGFPGWAVLAALLAAAAWMIHRGWRPSPLVMASVVGIVALFGIIALVRDGGLVGRYVTPFAVLALLIVGRMPWPRHRWLTAGGLLVFAWALVVNVAGLARYEYEYAYFLELGYGCSALSVL